MSERPPPVPGFRASGVACGIKKRGLDLALIAADAPAAAAGVFTRSSVVGAPVEWSRARVRAGRARAVIANSGVSNVAMGERGRRDARAMAALAGRALGCAPEQVLVASTGVIGEPLPMARIRAGVPRAAAALSERGLPDAARAILTTDTRLKLAWTRARIGGARVTIAGIAKGSGMIEPRMATMLAFLLTDAAVAPAHLRRALRAAVDPTLNCVSIDGETSTSDTALLLASGAAGNATLRAAGGADAGRFAGALREVCEQLARELARDGEGATRLLRVRIRGARSAAEADRAARRVANSLLVKTAVFGGDANWGRVLQTLGAGRVRIDLSRARVRVAGVAVFAAGRPTGPAARRRAGARLRRPELSIEVDLAAGSAEAAIWTCDLSYDYVRINAEYTT